MSGKLRQGDKFIYLNIKDLFEQVNFAHYKNNGDEKMSMKLGWPEYERNEYLRRGTIGDHPS